MIQTLAVLAILFPLIGFVINFTLGDKLKDKVGYLATALVAGSFIFTCVLTHQVSLNGTLKLPLYNWVTLNDITFGFNLLIDQLTVWMMLIITGIGSLIHLYSIGYMAHDEGKSRFFAYLNLFIFSMLLLVMGSNLVILFMGWEGVGLCSYLLIGFWYKNNEYGHAARKAFIMNRIGDLGFLIAIFICIYNFGTVEMNDIQNIVTSGHFKPELITMLTLFLFLGATGKSAQIPLYTWLPDAMAGPTPVSALIHAATMVTAGVYLIVRNAGLFELAPITQHVILFISLATAILAAMIALFQNDIKKVLAYSTVSQLGFMFMALGVGAYSTAVFHLTTHAFFKALLFLGAGSVIHAVEGNQDIMTMGGLKDKIKKTHLYFLIGTLAIIGFPLFSGFFSKDEILEKLFEHSIIAYVLAFVTAGLTIIYMLRLYFLTFWGKFRGNAKTESHIHESPTSMTFPLMILAILSLFGGILNLPNYMGERVAQFLNHWIHPIFSLKDITHSEHLPAGTEGLLIALAIGLVFVVGGATYTYFKKQKFAPKTEKLTGLAHWAEHKFYVDQLYNKLFVKPTEYISNFLYNTIELKVISPMFIGGSRLFYGLGVFFKTLQNGNIEYYLTYFAMGVLAIMSYFFITH